MDELTCFKTYDIRGEVDVNLTPDIARRIGRAYAVWLHPRRVVVGADVRLSSEALKTALIDGLTAGGVDVIDLGMTGTEEVYFATRELRADGGIQVTASHNPAHYNGFKLVGLEARPISNDNGLLEIKALAEQNRFPPCVRRGGIFPFDNRPAWVNALLRFITTSPTRTLRLVVNAGHGTAGPALDALDEGLKRAGVPVEFIRIHHQPDGRFPAGVPITRCCLKTGKAPDWPSSNITPMLASPGMAISIVAFSSTSAGITLRTIISWGCLPNIFCDAIPAAASFLIPA